MLRGFTLSGLIVYLLFDLIGGSSAYGSKDDFHVKQNENLQRSQIERIGNFFEASIGDRQLDESARCTAEGDPCEDDGIHCNGEEICDANLQCTSVNPPCSRCNEVCDEEYIDSCMIIVIDCLPPTLFESYAYDDETCECIETQRDILGTVFFAIAMTIKAINNVISWSA